MSDALEAATDELYGAALEEFTRERARLAAQLRADDQKEEAAAFSKLRKPSVSAWVLNQLARSERRDVDLLLDAGHRLRQAQVSALGGAERDEFERARKTERDAIRRLLRGAEALLRDRGGGSAATLNQIEESLRAAAVDPAGRELLARGRFVQPLTAQGFEVFGALASPPRPAGKAARPRPEERRALQEKLRAARGRVREAEARVRAAEQTVAHRRTELAEAERAAEKERARLEQAIRARSALEDGASDR